jgi:hypothetical protein
MISSEDSSSYIQSETQHYTVVSTFEKKNSLSIKLIFGKAEITRSAACIFEDATNALEHLFLPKQIFGIELESKGKEYQKFHYVLVVQSCDEGERGTVIPGISPGARVLIQTKNNVTSKKLYEALNTISRSGVDLTLIDPEKFHKLQDLLSLKIKPNFFIGELLG